MADFIELSDIVSLHLEYYDRLLLAAMFAQMLLTIGVLIRMGILRVAAVQSRAVRASEITLGSDKYPEAARKAGNSLNNQFQLPVLFYALVAILLIVGQVSALQAYLGWAFVISRFIHAAIHMSTNDLNWRFGVYLLGVFILTAFLFSVFWPIFF